MKKYIKISEIHLKKIKIVGFPQISKKIPLKITF
jgi:hypothetical protein